MTVETLPTALVPGVRALLPENASLVDPVADLRAACLAAVVGLGSRVQVVASDPGGTRVGEALVVAAGAEVAGDAHPTGVLVVGNGSAKRTEKAPGHFDERAEAFDAALRADVHSADAALATDLWADVATFDALPPGGLDAAEVLYDDVPFGVQYWVALWR